MAADTPGNVGNLNIAQQINDLLNRRTQLLQEQERVLDKQVALAMQLKEAFKSDDYEKLTKSLSDTSKATSALTTASETLDKSQKNTTQSVKDASDSLDNLQKTAKSTAFSLGILNGAFKVLKGGISGVVDVSKVLLSSVVNIMTSLLDFAGAIVSIPFKILSGLIGMANELPTGASPIRIELEAIRKAFGSLASNEGKALSSTLGQFRKEFSNLAGTGLSVSRVFGWGPEGLAKAMTEVREVAEALGARFNQLQDEFRENAVLIAMVNRGLMVNAESMAATLSHARALGEDGSDYLIQITGMAQKMSNRFGIAAKVIGKGVGEMMKDISDFGALSKKQMVAAATYAGKLGVEIKDLGTVMNKYLNFEDAAVGAAQMAQAFGMNVDALELMKGGPEAIDEMRKAFFASGRSLDQLSTAERKLLEQQSGLQGAAMEAAFAASNQAVAYDQVAQAADDAGATQYSQVEVMKKLADSIERFVGSGGRQFTSFWDAFMQGFADGVKRAPVFLHMLMNIRRSLTVVYWHARQIGRAFVELFPGVKKFAKGMSDIFNPRGIAGLMDKFIVRFKDFFKALGDPTKRGSAVKVFLDGMRQTFREFFNSKSGAVAQIIEGGSEFFGAIKEIFKQGLLYAVKGLSEIFVAMHQYIMSGKVSELGESFKELFKNAFILVADVLEPAFKFIMSKLPRVLPYISQAIEKLWSDLTKTQMSKDIVDSVGKWIKYGIIILAVAAAVKGLGAIILAKIGASLFGDVQKGIPSIMSKVTDKISKNTATSGQSAASAIEAVRPAAESSQSTKTNWKRAAVNMVAIAAFTAALIYFLPQITASFVESAKMIKKSGLSLTEMSASGAVLAAVVLSMAGIATVMKLLNGIKINPSIIVGVLALTAVLAAMIGSVWLLNKVAIDIDPKKMKIAAIAVGALAVAGVAVTAAALAIGMAIVGSAGIGAAAIAIGVTSITAVMGVMITSLIPVINQLSEMKMKNPDQVSKVVSSIVAIISASSSLAMSVAAILEKIPSSIFDTFRSSDAVAAKFTQSIEAITSLISMIQQPIKNSLDMITNLMGSIRSYDPKTIESTIKMLDAVMIPMGNMISMTSTIFNQLIESSKGEGGAVDTNKVRSLTISFQMMIGVLSETMTSSLAQSITNVLKIAKDMPDMTSVQPQLKSIGVLLNVMAEFGKIVQPYMSMKFEKGGTGAASSIEFMMTTMSTIAASLTRSLFFFTTNLLGLFQGATGKQLDELSKPQNLSRFESLGKLFDVITKFGDVITRLQTIGQSGESKSFDASVLNKTLGEILDIFSWSGNSLVPKLIGAIEGLSMIPASSSGKLIESEKSILALSNALTNTFVPMIETVNKLPADMNSLSTKLGSLPTAMILIQSTVMSMSSGMITPATMLSMSKNLDDFSSFMSTQLSPAFDIIADIGPKIQSKVAQLSDGLMTISRLQDQLEGSNPDIKFALDIGKQLSTEGKVTVEIKPATFNFNIHVTMDAEKVAEGLSKTDVMKSINGQR